MAFYKNRADAGRRLGETLRSYRGMPGLLVLGLPRGGVPVAAEVARALGAPLDLFLVRKLGLPGAEELAMGAIAQDGARVRNEDVIAGYGITEAAFEAAAAREMRVLASREQAYRRNRPPLEVAGRAVILVDDGVATGASAFAALRALRALNPKSLILAVPVGSGDTLDRLAAEADRVVCPFRPEPFFAIGAFYDDFAQTTDQEVLAALDRSGAAARQG